MAYNIDGKVYTEHPLLDEIVFNAKLIVEDMIIKNTVIADGLETAESLEQSEYLISIKEETIHFDYFPFTADMFLSYGYTTPQARMYILDRSKIPKEERDDLMKYCSQYFIDHYVELNDYYRMLNGEPEYESGEEYYVYIEPDNPKLLKDDDLYQEFNFTLPLHLWSSNDLNTLETLGILDEVFDIYTGEHYEYLHHLGVKKVWYYEARSAKIWDILYIPSVEPLVGNRFREIWRIDRDIYYQRTYQDAMNWDSDYYDEIMMLCIASQTITDLIAETPEWYIRRDIFDLRTCKYFLDSNGIKFFKEIPLKYQIRIVKNMNRLIRYKSTDQNFLDILDIFALDGTTIYKHHLFKKWAGSIYEQTEDGIWIPDGNLAELDDDYDFGNEDEYEEIYNSDKNNLVCYDFINEQTTTLTPLDRLELYDFGNEDEGSIPDDATSDYMEERIEATKRIVDEDGNYYELEFVKWPLLGCYDDTIKDFIYRENYDTLTYLDPYWDGEDVHSYIKNRHLERDFTIERTKYLRLECKVSMEEYTTQIAYFNTLIFQSNVDLSNICLAVPSIKPDMQFGIQNLFTLLYCFNCLFYGKSASIRLPGNIREDPKKSEYKNYNDYDGGDPCSDIQETDINAHDPSINQKYRQTYDGGEAEYSEINHESHYDWLRWNYPYLWVDLSGRILSFNMNVDLNEIENNISMRHSKFDWEHGFTLKDLHVDTYKVVDKVDTIDELVDLYENNLKCYRELKELLINTEDRNEKQVYWYVYNSLFTSAYPFDFYRLHTGKYAETWVDILKEKDYTLYKFYKKIEKETNPEVRKEMVRGVLNDIVETLEWWLSGDNFKYVFCWVATHSLDAIVQYIYLMLNFFKSWKAYFLDPTVCYILDDKTENTQNHNDTITEIKESYWFNDNNRLRDRMNYTEIYYEYEWRSRHQKEFLDIMVHYEPEKPFINYDGRGVEDESTDYNPVYDSVARDLPIINGWYNVEGGGAYSKDERFGIILPPNPATVSEPDPYDPLWEVPNLDFGDEESMEPFVEDQFTVYFDFGDTIDIDNTKPLYDYDYNKEYPSSTDIEYWEPIEPVLDFSKYSLAKPIPFFQVNGGMVAARQDVYDLDGAGSIDMQFYQTVDGKHCIDVDENTLYQSFDGKHEYTYDVNGGGGSIYHTYTESIITHSDDHQFVTMDIRISRYNKNAFRLTSRGLYIKDIFLPKDLCLDARTEIISSRKEYEHMISDYIDIIKVHGDYDRMCSIVDSIFNGYFCNAKDFMNNIRKNYTKVRTEAYIYKRTETIRKWFIEVANTNFALHDLDAEEWEYDFGNEDSYDEVINSDECDLVNYDFYSEDGMEGFYEFDEYDFKEEETRSVLDYYDYFDNVSEEELYHE